MFKFVVVLFKDFFANIDGNTALLVTPILGKFYNHLKPFLLNWSYHLNVTGIIKMLINNGADINRVNNANNTALILVLNYGKYERDLKKKIMQKFQPNKQTFA